MRCLGAVALVLTIVRGSPGASGVDEDDLKKVDVEKLASMTHGTELFLLENAHGGNQAYRFEDFFWTGSGDGVPDGTDYWSSESPATIYKTKTVVSTVYIESTSAQNSNTSSTPPTKCTHNCEGPLPHTGEINPTPTYSPSSLTTPDDYLSADRQFWLLTVLKSDGKDPVLNDLKNSLAKLYKTAFQRQQERHLGINNRTKRDSKYEKPVNVYIHEIFKTPEKIEVLYHVTVQGKPVLATTAADDMTLVTDDEVVDALGYPFVIKAEPYLKPAEPQSLSKSNSTWIFIGASLTVLLILLLLIAFMTLGFTKRKKSQMAAGIDNRRQVFDEEGSGYDNKGYTPRRIESPTYINFRHQDSNKTLRSGLGSDRATSSSSSSVGSLDISPLMPLGAQSQVPKKPPRPKAALNKTVPVCKTNSEQVLLDSDSSTETPDTIFVENTDPGVVSPKSYLSMPSVKAFPRNSMPEPLNKVLEPVSVLHLDVPDDAYEQEAVERYEGILRRHGSVGAVEDPGVIGPIVWNMHCQRLQHGVSMDEGMEDLRGASNIARMRKRFHDLLDDTFSLFGSKRASPENEASREPIEVKTNDASRPKNELRSSLRSRPKTTDLRRVVTSPHSEPPRGAWMSTTPSPLVRPVSAGPFQRPVTAPSVNVAHVLAEGRFRTNDPAVPLISAIKSEIERCSLPGSTADLRQ